MDSLLKQYFEDDDEEQFLLLLQQSAVSASMTNMVVHGGSHAGRQNVDRGRLAGHQQIIMDYFSETPVYNDKLFRRRFRMRKSLFLRIMAAVETEDAYFTQKLDACGVLGLSTI